MNRVCLHHDAGCLGAAVPVKVWERRLQVLKEMGCNAIRTAHNPVAPEFLELLDIVGYNYVDRWHERRELFYSIDRHNHPDWKMVGTESVSNGGLRGEYSLGTDTTRVFPNYNTRMVRAEQLWKFVAMNPYVIGDFMWTGIDYLGESRWNSTKP